MANFRADMCRSSAFDKSACIPGSAVNGTHDQSSLSLVNKALYSKYTASNNGNIS
jgi:hypothetical protein